MSWVRQKKPRDTRRGTNRRSTYRKGVFGLRPKTRVDSQAQKVSRLGQAGPTSAKLQSSSGRMRSAAGLAGFSHFEPRPRRIRGSSRPNVKFDCNNGIRTRRRAIDRERSGHGSCMRLCPVVSRGTSHALYLKEPLRLIGLRITDHFFSVGGSSVISRAPRWKVT
jgi:hypothetical protein